MPMNKGKNFNRPKKGSKIRVEPIKKLEDIELIKKMLMAKPLDYALFVVGINTNLRASDLLRIKHNQVANIKPGHELEVREKKTQKLRRFNLNSACVNAINRLITSKPYRNNDDLFKGQRGTITVPALNLKVKSWCKAIGLKGNYGSHSLRKSWAYHQRITYKVDLSTLMVCLNHSSQEQTLTYICVQPEEIRAVYENEL